jgi:hypothetical protein
MAYALLQARQSTIPESTMASQARMNLQDTHDHPVQRSAGGSVRIYPGLSRFTVVGNVGSIINALDRLIAQERHMKRVVRG